MSCTSLNKGIFPLKFVNVLEIYFRHKICYKKLTSSIFPDMLERLNDMNNKLEDIQKSLDMYLETKRQIFPRFYFLSNDDLLEILGQVCWDIYILITYYTYIIYIG